MKLTQSIRRVLVIACMLAPLSVPGLGSAATISGTSCKREGSTRKVGDYEFVCRKGSNGKLQWRQQQTTPSTTTTTTRVSLSCAAGGVCAVGDTGPGGGIVFYVHALGTFACGPTGASTCKYLEAAPTSGTNAWTDSVYVWSDTGKFDERTLYTAVGTGYRNTEAMVAQSNTAGMAGTVTRAYRGPNNLTDWYLPSLDELNELCRYSRSHITPQEGRKICWHGGSALTRPGFSADIYWSSTSHSASGAFNQSFRNGSQGASLKSSALLVRPVRAF